MNSNFWNGFEKEAASLVKVPTKLLKHIKRLRSLKDRERLLKDIGKNKDWFSSIRRDF